MVQVGVEELPPEVWAMVCWHLDTADLLRLSDTCWLLRVHALARVKHHAVSPLGLVSPPQRMVQVLQRLGAVCGRLRSLDLVAWENLSARVLREVPATLLDLNLSFTTITSKGIGVLSPKLQALDLRYANVSRRGIRNLSHLTSLQRLNLSYTKVVTASSLQYFPDSVEELDLSYCPGLVFEKRKKAASLTSAFSMAQVWQYISLAVKWPASLRVLNLEGIKTASASLFGLPPTVRELNVSNTAFRFPRFDFTTYLPHLETFIAQGTKFNCTFEKLWALPEGLKTLSLRDSSADASNLKYLPASITSLDLAFTLVTEYCSLYEQEKINFFFKDISRCMPNLRLLDLRCGFPYGSRKYGPCLRGKVETLLLDQPLAEDAEDTIPELSEADRWRPREEHEEWRRYMDMCATSRESVNVEPVEEEGEEDESEDDSDDQEDELGALLCM